jgi:hypothetical protein
MKTDFLPRYGDCLVGDFQVATTGGFWVAIRVTVQDIMIRMWEGFFQGTLILGSRMMNEEFSTIRFYLDIEIPRK